MPKNEIKKKVRVPKPLQVIGDAAVASPIVGDGRLIPVLIVDTTPRPDVEELIRVHQHISDGDCRSQWGQNLDHKDQVVLQLDFIRPMQLTVTIGINALRQGILVEAILETQSLYLMSGRPGDRFISKQDSPRMLVEVPRGGFGDTWEKLMRHALRKEFRGKGLSRPAARMATEKMIEETRKLTTFRFKNRQTTDSQATTSGDGR